MQHARIYVLCANIAIFHRTDSDTNFLADFRAKKSTCPTCAVVGHSTAHTKLSVRLLSKCVLFLARMSVGDQRVYMCTCTVHDKLTCTTVMVTHRCNAVMALSWRRDNNFAHCLDISSWGLHFKYVLVFSSSCVHFRSTTKSQSSLRMYSLHRSKWSSWPLSSRGSGSL